MKDVNNKYLEALGSLAIYLAIASVMTLALHVVRDDIQLSHSDSSYTRR